ncbi:MAG: HdeD family acid-resistance protein, partial [Myxococcales bacterium]
MLTLVLASAAAGAAAYAAYRCPRSFRAYSESLRNLSLLVGIVLLVWNLAVAVTV